MKSPLRILHLENDANDAALVQSALVAEGIAHSIVRAQERADFVAALERSDLDLVIADYALPSFDGLSALKIMREKYPGLPFILVSGTLGEELAVESLKSGATDYVLKDRLSRLAPAIRRAMLEVETRADRKRLEEQFIEAQKMEVIGHLAAGVAHDFNNILGVIIGYGDLILNQVPLESPAHKFAGEIHHAAERAAALTRQLLIFSRKQTIQPVVLDLNEVVGGMNKMLQRLIDDHIELVIVPEENLGCIKADSGQIGQVLMNLVVNARDAMPNGGKVIVKTENANGDSILLSVSDTGTGMDDEVKSRLFEAFFTTKPKGKGTGLGLATCQTIVKQCGGRIDVQSELGKGTTFNIYFPRVEESPEKSARSSEAISLLRGTETILFVEDDSSVRQLTCAVLESQGYTVLRASNGQEGLRVARECKNQTIQLVITDIIMPQMSGKVMVECLKTIHPDLKILFTSGYNDEAIAQHGILEPGVAFLAKPYTPAALTREVRDLLDEKNSETIETQSAGNF